MLGTGIPVGERAQRLHRDSLVLDCHSHFLINGWLWKRPFHRPAPRPWLWNPLANALDLESAVRGGLKALAFTSYVPGRPLPRISDRWTDSVLDRYFEIVEECGGKLAHCETAEQIRQAAALSRLAGFLAIEGAHVLEGKLDNVAHFRSRGVRMITLTHFVANDVADGTLSVLRPNRGLSAFGREVVAEMERQGVLVDVAHCTDKALQDVLAVATRPIVYSHGALRRYRNYERNLPDGLVRDIAQARGLVGVIFFPKYLGGSGWTIRAVARQCRDIANLASPSCLCLGSDMDGCTYTPIGFRDASDWPQVTQALLDEGFSEPEVQGILGENFLRLLGE